jgi:hypothetical protein
MSAQEEVHMSCPQRPERHHGDDGGGDGDGEGGPGVGACRAIHGGTPTPVYVRECDVPPPPPGCHTVMRLERYGPGDADAVRAWCRGLICTTPEGNPIVLRFFHEPGPVTPPRAGTAVPGAHPEAGPGR